MRVELEFDFGNLAKSFATLVLWVILGLILEQLASAIVSSLPSVNLSSIILLIVAFLIVFGGSSLIDRLRKPRLTTKFDKMESNRLKKLTVYFPDHPPNAEDTRTVESRFVVLKVTNNGRPVVITPKMRIPVMDFEKELLVIEPSGKDFITARWGAKYEEFERFKVPFATALTSDEKLDLKTLSLGRKESKMFILLLTFEKVPYVLTLASGTNLAYTKEPMPCIFDVEVFYAVKGKNQTKPQTFRITAPNWKFPEDGASVTEVSPSSGAS